MEGRRITLLHSKVDEILVPTERRSAVKLMKGECAGGALSSFIPPAVNLPLTLRLSPAERSKPSADWD